MAGRVRARVSVVQRSNATSVVEEGGGLLAMDARFHKAWLGHGIHPRPVEQQIEEQASMPQVASSIACVIERDVSASAKMKWNVCML